MDYVILFGAFLVLVGVWKGIPFIQAHLTNHKPEGFVNLSLIDPSIFIDLKYYGEDNFVGRRIRGYEKPICYITLPAALALKEVQTDLAKKGLSLLVWDAYRPQRAVEDFWAWAQNKDNRKKSIHYPQYWKRELFRLGYLARKSSHSRGAAVDLTLIDLATKKPLDMGTIFDFLDPKAHTNAHSKKLITKEQHNNRKLLEKEMHTHGFKVYENEWWHFTFQEELYPNQYFDFPIR